MKTAHNTAAEFVQILTEKGFKPVRWDREDCRFLAISNAEGFHTLRVVVDNEGEDKPHAIGLLKLDGQRSQAVTWRASLSAHMPLAALLALIDACA